jgi:hypothetical protein
MESQGQACKHREAEVVEDICTDGRLKEEEEEN